MANKIKREDNKVEQTMENELCPDMLVENPESLVISRQELEDEQKQYQS